MIVWMGELCVLLTKCAVKMVHIFNLLQQILPYMLIEWARYHRLSIVFLHIEEIHRQDQLDIHQSCILQIVVRIGLGNKNHKTLHKPFAVSNSNPDAACLYKKSLTC